MISFTFLPLFPNRSKHILMFVKELVQETLMPFGYKDAFTINFWRQYQERNEFNCETTHRILWKLAELHLGPIENYFVWWTFKRNSLRLPQSISMSQHPQVKTPRTFVFKFVFQGISSFLFRNSSARYKFGCLHSHSPIKWKFWTSSIKRI